MRRLRLELILLALLAALSAPAAIAQAPEQDDWEALKQVYDYDATAPLQAQASEPGDTGQFTIEPVTYSGAEGLPVPGVLLRPRDVEKPPCVLFLHGYGGSKDQAQWVATLLAPRGIAVFAIDAVLHGERAEPDRELFSAELLQSGRPIVRTVVDNRRAIDYLETRQDVDAERVALLGVSMGGIFGSILAAVEPRIDAAALIVAGGRWDLLLESSTHPSAVNLRNLIPDIELVQQVMRSVEPVNFVEHIAPRPLLMVNGEQDQIIPRACTEALHNAAGEPNQVIWYQGGHIGMPPHVIGQVIEWLAEQCALAAPEPAGVPEGAE